MKQALVLRDTTAVIEDIVEAWADVPPGEAVMHEMHCFTDGQRRGRRRSEIRFEPLSASLLSDVRDKLEHWAANLARGARARNTVDALRADLRLFAAWCRNTSRIPLPATQDTLIAFLNAHAETRKVSTLKRYLASVATLHSAAGLSNPAVGELVRSEIDRIARNQAQLDRASRAHGKPVRFAKRQAAPLREEDLRCADSLFDPSSLRDLRDRAIVWLAFDTLARSSELAEMLVSDLEHAQGGQMVVTIQHSKSDQYGEGSMRYVSTYTTERLSAWLRAAGITEGYVFRGIDTRFAEGGRGKKKKKVEHVRAAASRQVIYRAIKNCAARLYGAGLIQFDLSAYSAHSTRVGAAQDMLAEGVSMLAVQQAGGWKTDVMPQQYAKKINALEGGAAQLARKRNRVSLKRD